MPSVMKASAEVSPWALREVDCGLNENPENEWPTQAVKQPVEGPVFIRHASVVNVTASGGRTFGQRPM